MGKTWGRIRTSAYDDQKPRVGFLQCGRFVTDELVSVEEAHQLLRIAKKGLAKGGGAGGASILGH
jgi:hypothetical protein